MKNGLDPCKGRARKLKLTPNRLHHRDTVWKLFYVPIRT
jgi:hypothetical protein